MMKVTFETSGSLTDAINDAVRAAAQEGIAEKLEGYRCPEHAVPIESVTLSGGEWRGDALDNVQMRVSACCDRATEDACSLLGVGEE